jgi:hypothetical protein
MTAEKPPVVMGIAVAVRVAVAEVAPAGITMVPEVFIV